MGLRPGKLKFKISSIGVLLFSLVAAFFGAADSATMADAGSHVTPKIELIFRASTTRSFSFQQAVTDLRRSLLNKEEAKLTVLKISRAKGIDSEIKISCAKNGFLAIKNTILLASLRPALSSVSQEAARS